MTWKKLFMALACVFCMGVSNSVFSDEPSGKISSEESVSSPPSVFSVIVRDGSEDKAEVYNIASMTFSGSHYTLKLAFSDLRVVDFNDSSCFALKNLAPNGGKFSVIFGVRPTPPFPLPMPFVKNGGNPISVFDEISRDMFEASEMTMLFPDHKILDIISDSKMGAGVFELKSKPCANYIGMLQ